MRFCRALVAHLILTTLSATVAPAAVMAYTDRATFEAAIGPHVTYTFDTAGGFPAAPSPISSVGPVQLSDGFGIPALLFSFPDTSNQTVVGAYNPATDITSFVEASFASPAYAFGFDIYPFGSGVGAFVQFAMSPANVFYSIPVELDDPAERVFFGLISTDPITYFTAGSTGSTRTFVFRGIDNLTLAVPEPASLITVSVIAFAILLVHRRRHRGLQVLFSKFELKR
jgi:hypothetical protein